jgi:pimeloyl-ACP methyl ester carboxylesterase
VIFPATDGVRLRGAFYAPAGEGPFKTLILIHGAGSRTDRHIWDAFIPVLQGAGYAVLAYDARGAGLSDPVAPDSALPDSRVFDVTGALDWLDTRPEVDAEHVGIIGASLGANVAYAANGGTTRIRTAVLLSPLNTGEALLGAGVPGFVSRDVLFVCDEPGVPAAQVLFDQTRAPRELYTAAPGIRAQGTALLTTPEIVTEILNWLTEQL